ncbi:MAG: hypothetical protein M3179_15280 [Actinomycetota bacterium]|nr:hypothetical protein [Actinomycetota bacterium]
MAVVVVAGALANKAHSGGEAWVRLSWVRGLQRLGHDVRFVEEVAAANASPQARAYFRAVVDRFELADVATLLVDGEAVDGPGREPLLALAGSASLVNISGHLGPGALFDGFVRRIYVDIDPGFTQFWHVAGDAGARVEGHDLHYTIGENIGTASCPIPTGGIEWRPVRQPVVLDDWPVTPTPDSRRFTTVANWRGPFGPIEHDGKRYGLKVHEFRKFIELPRRSPFAFELALNIHPDERPDLASLHENRWRLVDPVAAAGDPDRFRAYVQGSAAEFSVAQGVYVDTGSGWFSDRTVRYLASGRPALVQDTGFGRFLPVGDGLVAFETLEQAVDGAAAIMGDHESHRRAARAVAEHHFDSDLVLSRFCHDAGIS